MLEVARSNVAKRSFRNSTYFPSLVTTLTTAGGLDPGRPAIFDGSTSSAFVTLSGKQEQVRSEKDKITKTATGLLAMAGLLRTGTFAELTTPQC